MLLHLHTRDGIDDLHILGAFRGSDNHVGDTRLCDASPMLSFSFSVSFHITKSLWLCVPYQFRVPVASYFD